MEAPEKAYLSKTEVAKILGISESYAYKIMRKLNLELEQKGYIVVSGRINTKYFYERTCYGSAERKDA